MSVEKGLSLAVAKALQSQGHTAVYAGGCVRDHLLGVEPKDYDIATSAEPEQVIEILEKSYKVIPVGMSFGVVRVVEGEHQIEIATLRTEKGYTDGRRPDAVSFTRDLKEDASRRDFTINAMFMDPVTEQIHDFFNGQVDLANRVIRPVGKASVRFSEDYLRMMRAARFVAQLDAQLDPDIMHLMSELAPKIRIISSERQMDELSKIFKTHHAKQGIAILNMTGILSYMFPVTKISYARLQKCPCNTSLEEGLSFILQDLPVDHVREVLKASKCSTKTITEVQKSLEFVEYVRQGDHYSAYKVMCSLGRIPRLSHSSDTLKVTAHWPSSTSPRLVTGLLIQSVRPDIKGVAMGDAIAKGARAQYDGVISNQEEAISWLKSL